MNENAKSELNVFVRVLRTLANSRELTLLVLIIILVGTMSIVYPNNFPTSSNMSAVLLNAAFALSTECGDLPAGIEEARASIDSGNASKIMESFVERTQRFVKPG